MTRPFHSAFCLLSLTVGCAHVQSLGPRCVEITDLVEQSWAPSRGHGPDEYSKLLDAVRAGSLRAVKAQLAEGLTASELFASVDDTGANVLIAAAGGGFTEIVGFL
jgi:hypothetical protein